jgi:hypothetical protein
MAKPLDLTEEERILLTTHLHRHIHHLDAELVRTDRREFQHALAAEIEQLRTIARRLEAAGGA